MESKTFDDDDSVEETAMTKEISDECVCVCVFFCVDAGSEYSGQPTDIDKQKMWKENNMWTQHISDDLKMSQKSWSHARLDTRDTDRFTQLRGSRIM